MKPVLIKIILLMGVIALPFSTEAREGVKASFPQVKPLEVSGSYIWYAIKTEVNNQSERENVCVTFQALDYESFEIDRVNLCDKVPINGVKILTNKTFMPLSDWKRINKWRQTD